MSENAEVSVYDTGILEQTIFERDDRLYDDFVERYWFSSKDREMSIAIAALGMMGEAAEASEKIKKMLRGDVVSENFYEEVGKELGDALFYITKLAGYCGLSIHQVMELNMKKLSDRRSRGNKRGDGDNR